MNGSFNPESFPPTSNDPQLNLPFTLEEILADHVSPEAKTISGGTYLALFRQAKEQGFSGADLEKFLTEKGIKHKSMHPPSKDPGTANYDTPDSGLYKPRTRR